MAPRERGRAAARARWGPPRIARLDELSPEARRLILALIDLGKAEPPQAV